MRNVGVTLGTWVGGRILEYCPYERPGCEFGHCWPAKLCRLASASRRRLGLWASVVAERHRETVLWLVLAVACVALVAVSFLWPFAG